MFTGLVREIGTVEGLRRRGGITHLKIHAPRCAGELEIGDSLAVDGVCLTVTDLSRGTVTVDAVTETLRVTTLGGWRAGRRIHLEPALKAGDRMGGHVVLGHVDGVGEVRTTRRLGEQLLLTIAYPPELGAWMLPKGSVAVDGVSLTLDAAPADGAFTASLIPHTLRETRFGELRKGAAVNLECDVLAKGAGHGSAAGTGVEPEPTPLTMKKILSRGWRRRGR